MTVQPRFEILVGLHIQNDENYDKYRASMAPLLKEHHGYFRYDFKISEMLIGDAEDPFNRVFVLSFPDEPTKERFFNNETYKQIRKTYFDTSVKSGGILASFTSP
ncbi:MAG: DUF1330 domain-containing protein [Phycisphaerales bacterium]|nr:DUF1330 domain-containing protein [Phycisphaerales bacterium]